MISESRSNESVILYFQPEIPQEPLIDALAAPGGLKYSPSVRWRLLTARASWFAKIIGFTAFIVIVSYLVIITAKPAGGNEEYIIAGILLMIGAPLWAIWSMLKVFESAGGSTPQDSASRFYSELLCHLFRNHGKAFSILAPPVLDLKGNNTIAHFSAEWNKVEVLVKSTISQIVQVRECCHNCDRELIGMWTQECWHVNDELLREKDSVRCNKCDTIYCKKCFVCLLDERQCLKCDTKLAHEALQVLIADPEIGVSFELDSIKIIGAAANGVVEIAAQLRTSCTYNPPWPTSDNEIRNPNWSGFLRCVFHNATVKIGECWYLLAGEPGRVLKEVAA